jgi:hypothetical protein
MISSRAAASLLVLAAATAHAESPADQAFARGQKLVAQGKYDEGCAAFEQSIAAEFAFGALYNLADCNVRRHHLLAALEAYERLAREDDKADRRAASAELAKKLAPRVPRIIVAADARPGLTVKLDDTDITDKIGSEIRVELGDHVVHAQLPGRPERRIDAPTKTEGALVRIEVAIEGVPVIVNPTPPAPARSHKLAASITIGGGVVVAAGLVSGTVAWLRWRDAQSAAMKDDQAALARTDSARTWGTASTILTLSGLAIATTGVVLWRHGNSEATVHATATSVSIVGRF